MFASTMVTISSCLIKQILLTTTQFLPGDDNVSLSRSIFFHKVRPIDQISGPVCFMGIINMAGMPISDQLDWS